MTAPRYRKPKILGSIPKDRHAVIEASAGTGKTYTLEHLVVELILSGVDISEILVVTFTRPATSELVDRIRKMLLHLLDLEEDESEGAPASECWVLDQEARDRIEVALRRFDTATISTIHAFCQGILQEHAFSNQRLFSEEMIDRETAFHEAFLEVIRGPAAVGARTSALLARWLEEKSLEDLEKLLAACASSRARTLPGWEDPEGAGEDPAAIQRMLGAIGAATSLEGLAAQELLPLVQTRLAANKREAGLIDYEDMLGLLRDSLYGEHGPALLDHLRRRYRYALIDEFQDTDELQWGIFRKIFFESGGGGEGDRPGNILYLIGDPKQAIYRFRGADVETYLRAREAILAAGGERVALEQNFRSTGALIEAYNRILEQDPERPFFSHPEIGYEVPVVCGAEKLALLGPDDRAAAPIHVFEVEAPLGKYGAPSRSAEKIIPPLVRAIAAEIRAISDPTAPGLRMRDKKGDVAPIALREIYVLCNSNSEARQVGAILREEGVPFAFFKQDGLFQTMEAAAFLDLLRAIADPADDSRRLQAWLGPFFEVPMAELVEARSFSPSHPLYRRLYEWKAEAEGRSFARLFARIFDESGIARRLILSEKGERELTNHMHIAELLVEAGAGRSLPELIALLARWVGGDLTLEGDEGNQQRLESDRDAVQIMTMHASKGLEAKVVFLVGGISRSQSHIITRSFHADEDFAGTFLEPGAAGERITFIAKGLSKPKGELKELSEAAKALATQEERFEAERLLYVALTRAKGRLYLPFYSAEESSKPLTGVYAPVDDRLRHLMRDDAFLSRISRSVVDCTRELPERREAPLPELEGWEPGASEPEAGASREELERLRTLHRGYRITSYTQLKPGGAPTPSHDPERTDFIGEEGRSIQVSVDELPGGAATGIFLHEVLALVPQEVALGAPTPAAFAAHPEVERLLRREAERAGFDPIGLPQAAALVHTSLLAKLRLRDGRTLDGVAAAPKLVREMEFLFPIPEPGHPRLGEPWELEAPGGGRDTGGPGAAGGAGGGAGGLPIRRGFVKGFVDVLFEHDGLAYFGDWKSDVLPSYTESEIRHRVEQSYRLQAKLYCLALVKMLDLRDEAAYEASFGGFLYLFIRGMRLEGAPGEAVHFERPSWADLLAWERELLERDDLEGAA